MRLIKCISLLLILLFSFVAMPTTAATGAAIRLEPVHFDTRDTQSVKRGAEIFKAQCMICHAMRYLEHDPIARSIGMTIDKMPLKDQEWWFGVAPPDLSLTARVHTPRWIYTYLHAFYKDESTTLKSNNLLVSNSKMPNPFMGSQGEQVLSVNPVELHKASGVFAKRPRYFSVLRLERQGSLTPDEFHQQIYDIVNFLVYASEPAKMQRLAIGWWVLGFLALLIVLTYLLKNEYWKNIK